MRVFVTGGTGFVGFHLVESLLASGHEVVCLVRRPAKARALFPNHPIDIVHGTIDNTTALAEGCTGADAVFHVAGLVMARSRAEFLAANGGGTRTLLHVASRAAPELRHFVYISSLAAAGPARRGHPLTEDVPAQPVSDYGWSKLAGEEAVRAGSLPWTIVRPPTVYGPRDRALLTLFTLAKRALMPVFGAGAQELSLVYGPDLAAALTACLTPGAVGRTFFASHREVCTARQFAVAISHAVRGGGRSPRILGIPPAVARVVLWATGTAATIARRATLLNADKAGEFLAEAWTCSPAAIEQATGWKAATPMTTGLAETVAWYREVGWL